MTLDFNSPRGNFWQNSHRGRDLSTTYIRSATTNDMAVCIKCHTHLFFYKTLYGDVTAIRPLTPCYQTLRPLSSVLASLGTLQPKGPSCFLTLWLPRCCNFTPRNVHERFQTLLTPVLTIFTDFLSAVVTSEIAQILSLYGGGFLALKWQS